MKCEILKGKIQDVQSLSTILYIERIIGCCCNCSSGPYWPVATKRSRLKIQCKRWGQNPAPVLCKLHSLVQIKPIWGFDRVKQSRLYNTKLQGGTNKESCTKKITWGNWRLRSCFDSESWSLILASTELYNVILHRTECFLSPPPHHLHWNLSRKRILCSQYK